MDSENEEPDLPQADDEEEVPLCLHCLQPVDPLAKICPHCGQAVGQLTPYLPFEGIRWQAGVWGQTWDQAQRHDTSIIGRAFRWVVIIVFQPILLVGLIPRLWRKIR